MPRVTIQATCIDPHCGSDPLTIETNLTEGGLIEPIGLTGWYSDQDGRALITRVEGNTFHFSDDDAWETNILRRDITIGQLFAIGPDLTGRNGEDYWVYRIDSVLPL